MVVFDKILETALYVNDLEQARNFYGTKLGLDEYSFTPNRSLFYRLSDGMLLIFNPAESKQQTIMIAGHPVPQHGSVGAGHMAFAIAEDQVETVVGHLGSVDIGIESVVKWPAGGTSIYVRDPANNSIEFATRSLWF